MLCMFSELKRNTIDDFRITISGFHNTSFREQSELYHITRTKLTELNKSQQNNQKKKINFNG